MIIYLEKLTDTEDRLLEPVRELRPLDMRSILFFGTRNSQSENIIILHHSHYQEND